MKDKLRELIATHQNYAKSMRAEPRNRVLEFAAELLAILDADGDGGAVGCLTISRFRGSDAMVNHDFDYYGNLPDGSYSLYTHPARSGVVRDEDVDVVTLRDLMRDAERYRWLRVQGFDVPADIWVTTVKGNIPIVHSDLDEAIDAAIKGERHER